MNLPPQMLGLLIGLPLGAVVASVWYELSGKMPLWVWRVKADEVTIDNHTTARCRVCCGVEEFRTLTVDGGLAHRLEFVRNHAFCRR